MRGGAAGRDRPRGRAVSEEPRADAGGKRIKGKERGAARKRLMAERALADISGWLRA